MVEVVRRWPRWCLLQERREKRPRYRQLRGEKKVRVVMQWLLSAEQSHPPLLELTPPQDLQEQLLFRPTEQQSPHGAVVAFPASQQRPQWGSDRQCTPRSPAAAPLPVILSLCHASQRTGSRAPCRGHPPAYCHQQSHDGGNCPGTSAERWAAAEGGAATGSLVGRQRRLRRSTTLETSPRRG